MRLTSYQWPADQPTTSPFPIRNGVFVALRFGDLYSPDSWKTPKHYTRQTNAWFRPYFSCRFKNFGFYLGWKAFGIDNESQKLLPGIQAEDVYPGSVAIQGFTLRFTRRL